MPDSQHNSDAVGSRTPPPCYRLPNIDDCASWPSNFDEFEMVVPLNVVRDIGLERDTAHAQADRIPIDGVALGEVLAKHGVIDPEAINDSENYDQSATLGGIYAAYEEMFSENGKDHS